MKRAIITILGCFAATTSVMLGQSQGYRDRWVYVSTDLDGDQSLDRVKGITRTASEHGINGMLLSTGFDSMDLKSPGGSSAVRVAAGCVARARAFDPAEYESRR
jgi:hypothetical protein